MSVVHFLWCSSRGQTGKREYARASRREQVLPPLQLSGTANFCIYDNDIMMQITNEDISNLYSVMKTEYK